MTRTRAEFEAAARAVNDWWASQTPAGRVMLAAAAYTEGMPPDFVRGLVRAMEQPHKWRHDAYRIMHPTEGA